MAFKKTDLNGPIPGENFTSDTRNYPWHRPPEYDDLNDAILYSFKYLTKPRAASSLLAFLDNGYTIVEATTAYLISGIGSGKWTLDYALLMAGPIARIMELMAEAYDVDYELGLPNIEDELMTSTYIRNYARMLEEEGFDPNEVEEEVGMDGQNEVPMSAEEQVTLSGVSPQDEETPLQPPARTGLGAPGGLGGM